MVGGWNARVFFSHAEAPRLVRNAGLHLSIVPKLIAKPGGTGDDFLAEFEFSTAKDMTLLIIMRTKFVSLLTSILWSRRLRLTHVALRATSDRLGRELLRLVVYGLVIITVSGAAFTSQYGDDRTIQTLRTLKRAVSGLSPGLGIKPPQGAPKSLHQVHYERQRS